MYDNKEYLLGALDSLNPACLSYTEWCAVGMALKEEGFDVSVWDEWSRNDSRYHIGECERKWSGFRGNSTPVTAGTIVQLAKEHGWAPDTGHELDWDDSIRYDDAHMVVDRNWLEGKDIAEPAEWNPAGQLIRYLETLFEAGENVGYVSKSWKNEKGRHVPKDKGNYDRTAEQLIEALSECRDGDIGDVIGDYDAEGGAWIRFNPLDGKGVRNENVTDFRYALVESDGMELAEQNAILRELELPIACLVYSGGKSLHAIVKIDAQDYSEYRKRVDYLYDVCSKNGMKVDTQNRNPSRLSRMPGVLRNGRKQFIVDTNLGKENWEQWHEWIESVNDDLPDPEGLKEIWDNMPELAPPLIENVLRQGHKMLIAGPSKAGKSFLLIEMCICIAEGRKWLKWDCAKGRVLHVNLELDRASCLHRFRDVYKTMCIRPDNLQNIDIWNLRGKSVPMDRLAPKLIRRAAKKNYIAVIIDPIYKVITGDENSADQMAKFCNQFDKICTELGTAVIYCHHHSKGSQGGKRSMDRASGSGVFARDPDALLDLIELETNDALMLQEENKAVCRICKIYLDSHFAWQCDLSQDDLCSRTKMLEYCREKLNSGQMATLQFNIDQELERVRKMTAWRIEGTLREFPKFDPVNLWFDYPAHRTDRSGALNDMHPEDDKPMWQRAADRRKESAKSKREKQALEFEMAYSAIEMDGPVSTKALAESLGITPDAVKKRLKNSNSYYYDNGIIHRKEKNDSKNDQE